LKTREGTYIRKVELSGTVFIELNDVLLERPDANIDTMVKTAVVPMIRELHTKKEIPLNKDSIQSEYSSLKENFKFSELEISFDSIHFANLYADYKKRIEKNLENPEENPLPKHCTSFNVELEDDTLYHKGYAYKKNKADYFIRIYPKGKSPDLNGEEQTFYRLEITIGRPLLRRHKKKYSDIAARDVSQVLEENIYLARNGIKKFLRLFSNELLETLFHDLGIKVDFSRYRNPDRYRTALINEIFVEITNIQRIKSYHRDNTESIKSMSDV